ncbi:MAG: hypothetical protein IJX39_00455 [Clostridia bacterium]|nr:hypothetical protein [Clostridia bacterium]
MLDIALSCGFKSSSGFYKTYKSLVGSTPKNSQFYVKNTLKTKKSP